MNTQQKQRAMEKIRSLFAKADSEGRALLPDERGEVERTLNAVQEARALDGANAAADAFGRDVGIDGAENGWSQVVKQLDLANGKRSATVETASLLSAKDLSVTDDDAVGFAPVRAPLAPFGQDSRFIHPLLASQQITNELAVQEWQQTGDRTLDSSDQVERDPTGSATKAELALEIEAVSEKVSQVAVTISDVPNAILEADQAIQSFLTSEASYQLAIAVDEHVISQVDTASPDSGASGDDLIAQVRNAVGTVRAKGANPTILALSPEDAATLDLTQVGSDDLYLFALRASGGSSPLFGLTIVESPTVTDPLLIDPQTLGVLYTASTRVDVDPYSGFTENLSTLRVEANVLFHVRNVDGIYVIQGSA